MTATDIQMEIPSNIARVSISVGLQCPQDSLTRRRVRVSDLDWGIPPGTTFFEQETDSIGQAGEKELVEQVIMALEEQGFQQDGDQCPSELDRGYHLSFKRGEAE